MGEYVEFLSRLADHEMLQFLGLPFIVFFFLLTLTQVLALEGSAE